MTQEPLPRSQLFGSSRSKGLGDQNADVIAVVAVGLGFGSIASAQPPQQPPSETLSSFQGRFVSHMMRADANHDGRVSLAEWTAFRAAHPSPNNQDDPSQVFMRIDRNHDGFITPDELTAFSAIIYQRRAARNGAPPQPH